MPVLIKALSFLSRASAAPPSPSIYYRWSDKFSNIDKNGMPTVCRRMIHTAQVKGIPLFSPFSGSSAPTTFSWRLLIFHETPKNKNLTCDSAWFSVLFFMMLISIMYKQTCLHKWNKEWIIASLILNDSTIRKINARIRHKYKQMFDLRRGEKLTAERRRLQSVKDCNDSWEN